MRRLPALLTTVVVGIALGACSAIPDGGTAEPSRSSSTGAERDGPKRVAPPVRLEARAALAGVTVVLDPGHQRGNARFASEINEPVDAGGFTKPCNTTGTATADGYPEATFTWQVAQVLRRALQEEGAEVVLTRETNSLDEWGPCVDERGRFAARGDLMISLHGDGNLASTASGFHVISAPTVDGSAELAEAVRDGLDAAGLERSTYLGADGLDSRTDLGTLNLAERPAVMVELGNMRHRDDAALMTTAAGRARYADGLLRGIRRHLQR